MVGDSEGALLGCEETVGAWVGLLEGEEDGRSVGVELGAEEGLDETVG